MDKLEYIDANARIRACRGLLGELTRHALHGYVPNSAPRVIIYQHRDNGAEAQFYNGTIYSWGIKSPSVKDEVYAHEYFHAAQHEYRERAEGSGSADVPSAIKVYSDGTLAEAGANKRSIIWNAMNEAGAYLFGFYNAYIAQHRDEKYSAKIAAALFLRFTEDYGVEIGDAYGKLMKTVLTAGLDTPEEIRSVAKPGRNASSRVALAALFAGLIYEMDGFDMGRAFADLLRSPDSNIARILSLGTQGADEHFTNLQMHLLGLSGIVRNV